MALVVDDRIKETTTTTGTSTYTLAGAATGFQAFSAIGDGNTTYYCCTDGTDFEVGLGTFTLAGTTLARTTIIESSNSNLAVSWSAGSKDIFCTLPASKALIKDASNYVKFADSEKLIFGDGNDAEIYHSGAHTYIQSNGTGNLYIRDQGSGDLKLEGSTYITLQSATNENYLVATANGAVTLYYDALGKLATTSTGIEVFGTTVDNGATHDGDVTFTGTSYNAVWDKSQNALEFADNAKASFGTGSDLQITHDNTNSYINNTTGNLYIRQFADDLNIFIQSDSGSGSLVNYFAADGSSGEAQLFHYGLEKLATQSGGINVTGTVTDDGATHDGDVVFTGNTVNITFDKSANALSFDDGARAYFGSSSDLTIYHEGVSSETRIWNVTGDLNITNFADDKKVVIATDNGSGGTANYIIANGNTGEVELNHFGTNKFVTKANGIVVYGDINLTGTVDGVDIATRDGVLTTTTTTADAALPRSGGTMTGDIAFEGSTADDFETTLTVADPTADQTITLPNQTGTAMLWQNEWPDDPDNYNFAIGDDSLASLTTGYHNVAYGSKALTTVTTGYRNTAIGHEALRYNTSFQNTAVGERTMNTNSTASNNTAVGQYALGDNATGNNNVAIGVIAGRITNIGCTHVGAYAGSEYVWGGGTKSYQISIGYSCADDGISNYGTGVGSFAMSDGYHYQSVGIGYDALGRASTYYPYYNTAVGYGAGNQLYSGDYNILVGRVADTQANTDSFGVAIGSAARAGYASVAVGHSAMASFSGTNQYNVCVGSEAGYDMDGGAQYCVFMGYKAGYSGGTGQRNTGLGTNSLYQLTTGANNSAVGMNTLRFLTSGFYNCALGEAAGYDLQTGSNNTFLGYQAGYQQGGSTTNKLTTGSNVTCLGFEAVPSSSTATNEITLGDNNISSLRCNVQTISSLSDERDKTAISDIPYGLDFINDMRPVQFTWNRRDGSMGAKPDIGFIAQELYETELDHSSSSRTRLVNWENPEKLEADYVRSYPILVKAVQELSAKCDALEARIATLEGN